MKGILSNLHPIQDAFSSTLDGSEDGTGIYITLTILKVIKYSQYFQFLIFINTLGFEGQIKDLDLIYTILI